MFAYIRGIFGGVSLWIYAAIFAIGLAAGGVVVHKWYQSEQVSVLKAEISRIQTQADARVAISRKLTVAAIERSSREAPIIKEVIVHVPSNPACNLPADATRLLNSIRQ